MDASSPVGYAGLCGVVLLGIGLVWLLFLLLGSWHLRRRRRRRALSRRGKD